MGLSFDSSGVDSSECKAILPNTNLHRRKYEIDFKNKKSQINIDIHTLKKIKCPYRSTSFIVLDLFYKETAN